MPCGLLEVHRHSRETCYLRYLLLLLLLLSSSSLLLLLLLYRRHHHHHHHHHLHHGVKGSWPGHTRVTVLPRSDTGGLRRAPAILQGC